MVKGSSIKCQAKKGKLKNKKIDHTVFEMIFLKNYKKK